MSGTRDCVELSDDEAVSHRMVGRRQRILSNDIAAYKAPIRVSRKQALEELVKASEDVSGYEL